MKVPRLRHNIAALGVVQIANYLIPMLTIPYLTRVLGVESFGQVAFVQAMMQYFILLTDYGFSWSATRQISANRDNKQIVSSIFASTWAAQWFLTIIAGLIFIVLILSVPQLQQHQNLYYAGFLMVISNILFPLWLLQGFERMKEVAIIQLSGRLAALPLLFLFVKTAQDTFWVVMLFGITSAFTGVLSLVWIYKSKLIYWKLPAVSDVFSALNYGSSLFLSNILNSSYTKLIPVVLGIITGNSEVAYYNLADKIRGAVQSMLSPLSQALFPRMVNLLENDRGSARHLVRLSIISVFLFAGSASFMIWFCADWIIFLLGGSNFEPAANVLRWLAPLPLVIGISSIFGVQVIIAKGLLKVINITTASVGIIALCLMVPITFKLGATGSALITLLAEVVVCLVNIIYVFRKKLLVIAK
jgi:O-antigen/teichoic acid export membrane protein